MHADLTGCNDTHLSHLEDRGRVIRPCWEKFKPKGPKGKLYKIITMLILRFRFCISAFVLAGRPAERASNLEKRKNHDPAGTSAPSQRSASSEVNGYTGIIEQTCCELKLKLPESSGIVDFSLTQKVGLFSRPTEVTGPV